MLRALWPILFQRDSARHYKESKQVKYLGTLPVSPSALAKLFAMLPVVVVVVVVVAKLAAVLP